MIAKVFMGVVFCSSLCMTGTCLMGGPKPESFNGVAQGGAPCFFCLTQNYCQMENIPCMFNAAADSYYYRTFAMIDQKFCVDHEQFPPSMGMGQEMCMAINYMECTAITWCSAMDCPMASCGEPGVEEKTTECNFMDGDMESMECMTGS